ncbi:hypothetical protein NL676_007778 [Syzygium grande]|nr:hypothetical protein NL676_007778 [Syzygium grande]
MKKEEEGSGGGGWLEGLMGEKFFGVCGFHEDRRKSEKNIFCLRCCLSICPHCLPSHPSHPLLQVRRYVYHDVIRLGDLEKLIDCSYIQPYTINGAKVIFLSQRAQSRACKGSTNFCFNCDRILQEPFHFCSLSCKVDYLVCRAGEDVSSILYKFNESDFAISQFEGLRMESSSSEIVDEDGQITPNSILENPLQCKGGSSSSEDPHLIRKKKKKSTGFLPGMVLSLSSRRKSAPQRAPFS